MIYFILLISWTRNFMMPSLPTFLRKKREKNGFDIVSGSPVTLSSPRIFKNHHSGNCLSNTTTIFLCSIWNVAQISPFCTDWFTYIA